MKAGFIKNIVVGWGVALVILVLAELILMAAGVTPLYNRTDTSVGFSGYAPLFTKSTLPGGEQIYKTAHNKTQWFNMQSFPATKSENVTRIFCVGGSTTYGRPYDDRTSFCGWLRLFLPEIDPTRRWEVINAGGISYASYRVNRLMEELSEYEPDLFIVYSGHNEFLESRTYGELLKVPGFMRSLAVQASRTRLYTLLYDLFDTRDEVLPTEVNALLDHSVGPEDYHRDDAMREAVLDEYRSSLYSMRQISERAGADMILVAPASNIRDFSPFKSEPDHDLSTIEIAQVDSLKHAVTMALDESDHARAELIARKALAIDERDPELMYLHGQALHSLGRMQEALTEFRKSRDEDVCPLRALSPIREIVTEVAEEENAGFVDFVGIISKHSPDGIPGSELFLDHVHPTIEGNRLLALALLKEMVEQGIVTQAASWNEDRIAEVSRELESSLDEETHAQALRKLSRVLTWAGKHDEAGHLVNLAMDMIPEDRETQIQKGVLLLREGDRDAALVHFLEAERIDPLDASIHQRIGILLSELNRMDEALSELEEAVRLDPGLDQVYYDLGIVLQALGKLKQAETAYRTALELDPDHAVTYNNLGVVLAQGGNIPSAAEQFERAVQLDPDNREAAVNLARARKALGRGPDRN